MRGGAEARPALALLLLVPSPSLGVLAGLVLWPGTPLGLALFSLSKAWILLLPLAWTRWADREPFGGSPARKGGFGAGAATGLAIAAGIAGVFFLLGDRLVDRAAMAERIRSTGLGTPPRYLGGALYFCTVNAILEEYVWRWFCYAKCRALLPAPAAVALAALFFTIHHVIALWTLAPPGTAILASAGVLAGGLIWSGLYARYGSVWPGYLSHAIADVAVFGVGAAIAFG